MRSFIDPFFSLAFLLVTTIPVVSQDQPPIRLSAHEIVVRWRNAVHAENQTRSALAVLASESNRDGIVGSVEEWVTPSSDYRSTTKRDYDDGEIVVTPQFAKQRDWNGFVRPVQGKELSRLQTEIFEKRVIIFGPPKQMGTMVSQGAVSQSDDKKMYLLRTTPAGGAPLTW